MIRNIPVSFGDLKLLDVHNLESQARAIRLQNYFSAGAAWAIRRGDGAFDGVLGFLFIFVDGRLFRRRSGSTAFGENGDERSLLRGGLLLLFSLALVGGELGVVIRTRLNGLVKLLGELAIL